MMADGLANRNVEASDDQNDTFSNEDDQLNSIDDVAWRSRRGVDDQHHVRVMKDLRQNAVDHQTYTFGDHKGLVDRRQSTVDSPNDHLVDEQTNGGVVDRNKATVEDSSGVLNENCGDTPGPGARCTAIEDRNKATVEETARTSHKVNEHNTETVEDNWVNCRQSAVDLPSSKQVGNSETVDRNKTTVENTSSDQMPTVTNLCHGDHKITTGLKPSRNVVDRDKKTVENTEPSTPIDSTDNNCVPASGIVDREKKTVENTEPSIQLDPTDDCVLASCVVDREKRTVENTEPTAQSSSADNYYLPGSNVVDPKKNNVEDTEPSAQSSLTDDDFFQGSNVVDREKRTVENIEPSAQKRLDGQEKTKDHSEKSSFGENSKIQFQVTNASRQSVINHLKNACFEQDKILVFGRGEGVDIFINDDAASRQHIELLAQILPNGQVNFMIRNISKTKGYHFNGKEITDKKLWTPLRKGDQIQIAGLVFVVVDITPARTNKGTFVIEFIYPHDSQDQPAAGASSVAHGSTVIQSDCHTNITPDMVERSLQPYHDQKAYVKLNNLRHLAVEAVGHWKELGRALGLEDWLIIMIDHDHPQIAEKSYQMLARWVWLKPEEAKYENLKKALEDITVGRGDLAEKYCTFEDN